VLKNIIVLFGPIVKFGGVIEQGRQNGSSIGVRFGGSRPTPCASAADEGALYRTASKNARSRAPKAVSCKRLLGGRAL